MLQLSRDLLAILPGMCLCPLHAAGAECLHGVDQYLRL